MPGDTCVFCGNTRQKDPSVSMHRFPRDPTLRSEWIKALKLDDRVIKDHHRLCSRHFPEGNSKNKPSISLGKRFASPKKSWTSRAKRAKNREADRNLFGESSSGNSTIVTPSTSIEKDIPPIQDTTAQETPPFLVPVGEQLRTDYQLHDLPTVSKEDEEAHVLLNTGLLAKIEALESENSELKAKLVQTEAANASAIFTVTNFIGNDELIKLYTGFPSYEAFLSFFDFLGPAVHELTYWGEKEYVRKQQRKRKLSSLDQFFLTMIKLKLNLRNKDLGYRFNISESLVSRNICTWICFLYQHLKEIDWTPSPKQVAGTLPQPFHDKYPTTFAIIDGSEIFIETPNDLHIQSSTWSSYKHHNTAKFLIACTPNGVVSFISPVYVGGISDVELTRVSGFLKTLEGKSDISIMADRGFTIKDQLSELGIKLNIPPFLDGRTQLPPEDIKRGRSIASLRIHVERAIGRIKQFAILKGKFPLSMIRLLNQVVCVCAWLTNFQPVLVPPPMEASDEEICEYFKNLEDDSDITDQESDDE